ncbi:MAG: hypothetical protein U0838_04435 [Chloroflexota bacterium]
MAGAVEALFNEAIDDGHAGLEPRAPLHGEGDREQQGGGRSGEARPPADEARGRGGVTAWPADHAAERAPDQGQPEPHGPRAEQHGDDHGRDVRPGEREEAEDDAGDAREDGGGARVDGADPQPAHEASQPAHDQRDPHDQGERPERQPGRHEEHEPAEDPEGTDGRGQRRRIIAVLEDVARARDDHRERHEEHKRSERIHGPHREVRAQADAQDPNGDEEPWRTLPRGVEHTADRVGSGGSGGGGGRAASSGRGHGDLPPAVGTRNRGATAWGRRARPQIDHEARVNDSWP